jgi:hypothetical protein
MKRLACLIAACSLCCFGGGGTALAPAHSETRVQGRRKLALLVTVSALKYKVAPDLRGPLNDARQMRRLLVDRYGFADADIETVEKTAATKAGIFAAFERLIARAKPGDLVVYYYSGHGVPVPDQTPLDEADGIDEAFVPYDANNNAEGDPDPKTVFLDDTLGDFLKRLPTKNVVVLLDACHSGTGTRGGGTPKRWLTVKRKPDADPDATPVTIGDGLGSDLTGPTVLTAAAASETAQDSDLLRPVSDDGNPNIGAFTFALLEAVNRTPGEKLSYRQVYNRVTDDLRQLGLKQTPQLEGSGLDAPFLALAVAPPPVPPRPLPPASGGGGAVAAISQGRVVSVTGNSLNLQRIGGGRFVKGSLYSGGGVTARIGATSAGGLEAVATVTQGTSTPALTGKALGQVAFPADRPPLRVAVTGDAATAQSVSALLRDLGGVTLVPANTERDVDLEVKTRAGQITVTPVRKQVALAPISAPISAPSAAALKPALVGILDNLQALATLLQLENPNPALTLDLKVNGQDGATLRVGDTVEFTLRASEDCYVYLVDVDPAGKVTVLFPNKLVPDNRLKAGQTYPMPTPEVYRLRVQGPPGPEVLKVIATRKPLRLPTLAADTGDFSALSAPALTVSRALWQELRATLGPVTGEPSAIPTAGWASDTAFLQVEAPRP